MFKLIVTTLAVFFSFNKYIELVTCQTVLILTRPILITTLLGRYRYQQPHFTDEKTEWQKAKKLV